MAGHPGYTDGPVHPLTAHVLPRQGGIGVAGRQEEPTEEVSRRYTEGELQEELDIFRRENDNLNDEELVAFLDSFLTRSSNVQ